MSECPDDECDCKYCSRDRKYEKLEQENKELRTRVAEQGQELEQKYDDDADTYESLFLLGVDPAGKTTAKCINELGEHIQSLESKLSTLLKASEGMEKALEEIYEYENTPRSMEKVAKQALAYFRAMKEMK